MSILSEEQRVRAVLRELSIRPESEQVREDVDRLQKLLEDPLFRQLSQKSLDKETAVTRSRNVASTTGALVDRLRAALEQELAQSLKENQRLVFIELDLDELRPSLLDSGEESILVVGPKDVKARTAGRLRIGDRIRALLVERRDVPSCGSASVEREEQEGGEEDRQSQLILRRPQPDHLDGVTGRVALAAVRESAAMVLSGDWTQVEVIRLSTEGAGLGFGIVGGASTGVVVKTILPGSPADKDKRLRPGDHILQIGNVSTHGMSSQQVASILRQQDSIVEMIVGRPINYADRPPDTSDCWTMSTRAALNSQTLEEFVQRAGRSSPPSTSTTKTPEDTILEREEEEHEHGHMEADEDQEQKADSPVKPESRRSSALVNGHQPATPSTSRDSKESTSAGQRRTSHDRKTSVQSGSSVPEVPCNGGPRTPTTSRISLRTLQEMALTVFLRENWENKPFDTVFVDLERDPALGLGITVAGYVHKKEEIGGVFVKSLVPRSAASGCGKILVHDLIVEVNDIPLEGLSHADSVRTLVKSGPTVRLKLVRFPPESAQAQCLRMLHEQETDTQVIDVQSSNPDLVAEWKKRINEDVDIISAVLKPDRKDSGDGGLGISLEGTVDVLNGLQLCPHHYVEGLRAEGPAAKSGLLQAGDELLQVNHSPLYGESHVTVRQALTRAVNSGAPVTLIVARRTQHVNLFQPTTMQTSLPAAYPLLAHGHDRVVKAKSEINLKDAGTENLLRLAAKRLRSRSLEPMEQLAIWNCVPLVLHLDKDVRGLGFSVVDYQDPSHPGETVIVVQSLVPGGIAQADGRIVPGDRLLFVNNHDLSNSSLERAVAVLKSAPMGRVRLGIAKPVPVDQCAVSSHSPLYTRSERLLARGSSPRGRRRKASGGVTSSQETVWIGAEEYRRRHPQGYYQTSRSPSCSLRSLDGTESMASWSPCSTRSLSPAGSPLALRGSWAYDVVYLPTHLERSIKLQKGALPLGVVLDSDRDKGVNGCVVKSICGKKAVALDGRLQQGDYLVKINTESLRNVTNSQARAILKRTNLIGTQCNITYITAADAKAWKERFGREPPSSPVINRLSPKVFPKFYRSPYLSRKSSFNKDTDDEHEPFSEASDAGISELHMEPLPTVEASTVSEGTQRQEIAGRDVARLIDGMDIDEMVEELIQEALRDALIELVVAHKTPDWNINEPSTSWHGKEITPPPSRASLRGSPSPPAAQSPPRVPSSSEELESPTSVKSRTSDSLIRRDSEPASLKPASSEVEEQPGTSSQVETPDREYEADITVQQNHIYLEGQPSTSSALAEEVEIHLPPMKRLSTRTASSGSDTLQSQARQLTRSKFWGEARTVVLTREANKSFGISIVGGRVEVSQKGGLPGTGNTVSGIFIKSVLANSLAGQSGGMNMGDRVISVNDVDLREATHEQAVAAIKNASNPVKFVLQSLHSFTPPQNMISSSSTSTVGSIRVEPYTPGKAEEEPEDPSHTTTTTAVIEERPREKTRVPTPEEVRQKEPITPPEEPKDVSAPVKQPSMEIKDEEETPKAEKKNSVTFVQEKRQSVKSLEAKSSIKREEKKKASMKKRDTLTEDTSYASGPLIVSDVSSSETHDDELASTSGIDATSAAMAADTLSKDTAPSRFGYTKGKLQSRYGHLEGEVILVDCESVPEAGLGISLAGNRDREKLNIFVINVKVACPLAIKKGDEILEVNGRVLRGLSHVVASNIIRECCSGPLEMIICRREGALADCAVQSDPKASSGSTTSTPAAEDFQKALPLVEQEEQPSDGSMPPTNDSDTALQTIEAVRKKSFSLERTIPIEVGKETLIEIDKEGKGLGLSIVGGSDTVLGAVVIHEVYPDGAAAHDGRLKPGDQVLEVNKTNLRGMTHDQAISTLRRTPPKVRLLVYRDVNLQLSLLDPTQIYNLIEIELTKKPGKGLGLSIVGRKNEPGVYVSEVVKGGTAEADGRLMTGDQILIINGQDVAASMQEDVAAMLKTCVGKVSLKVGRWKLNETTTRVHAAAEAASNLTASTTTPRVATHHAPAEPSTSAERQVPSPAPPMPRPVITHTNAEGAPEEPPDLSPVQEEASTGTEPRSRDMDDRGTLAYNIHHDLKEEGSDTLMVELRKVPDQQLGMGIGKRTRGILVTSLQPGSAAAEKLKVGDRILAVNALPVTDQLSAVTFVKASGERLFLQIARPRASH